MSSIEGSCWPSALTFAALPIGFLPGFDANLNLSVKEFYNKDNNLGGTPQIDPKCSHGSRRLRVTWQPGQTA